MRTTPKRIGYLLALLAILIAPQPTRAGAKEEARKHYDRAVELVDDGQLAEAIIEFQRAYDLTKHFSVLFNIGQVYVSLAKPVEAIGAYEGYLVGGGKNIPKARRAEVEKEIARQKTRIATLVFRILPDGATLRVDGNDIGNTPVAQPLSVGIGEHVVSALADGHQPAEVKVTMAGEDRRTIELTLAPIPEKKVEPEPVAATVAAPVFQPAALPPPAVAPAPELAPTASTATEAPPKSSHFTKMQMTGLAAGAAGIAGVATGMACWMVARSRHDDAVTYWNQGGSSDAKATSLQGQAKNYVTAANISFVAGGTLAAMGVALYIFGTPKTGDVASSAKAHVLPMVGRDLAGLTAGGTW
jgi:hypothetical protein